MRIRNFLIAVAVLALAVPGLASAESTYKVTGGGQVVADREYPGPGDTYGFNAIATGPAEDGIYPAKGRFNHIDREESEPGDGQRGKGEHIQGIVTCLESTGPNTAQFGGELRERGQTTGTFFLVDVMDNGESGTDLIYYRTVEPEEGDTPCDEDEEHNDSQLARGNLKIHDGGGEEEEEEEEDE